MPLQTPSVNLNLIIIGEKELLPTMSAGSCQASWSQALYIWKGKKGY